MNLFKKQYDHFINESGCGGALYKQITKDSRDVRRMNVLASFDSVSVPSMVGLDKVRQYIALHGIKVDDVTAREILTKIALDIDLNYVNSAVQYHADEFISSWFDTGK